MTADPDPPEDRIERVTRRPTSPGVRATQTAGLPIEEPSQETVAQQRADLLQNLRQLESSFRYMGTAHPRYAATRARIDQLRSMLAQLDQVNG